MVGRLSPKWTISYCIPAMLLRPGRDFLGVFVGGWWRACWVASFQIVTYVLPWKGTRLSDKISYAFRHVCMHLLSQPHFHHGRTVDARGKAVWGHLVVGLSQSPLLRFWIIQILLVTLSHAALGRKNPAGNCWLVVICTRFFFSFFNVLPFSFPNPFFAFRLLLLS